MAAFDAPTARPACCTRCGGPLIGRDAWRDTCAWCEPAETATCPSCWGSGTRYRSAADIDGDDCPVCGGFTVVVTHAGAAAMKQGRAA